MRVSEMTDEQVRKEFCNLVDEINDLVSPVFGDPHEVILAVETEEVWRIWALLGYPYASEPRV